MQKERWYIEISKYIKDALHPAHCQLAERPFIVFNKSSFGRKIPRKRALFQISLQKRIEQVF